MHILCYKQEITLTGPSAENMRVEAEEQIKWERLSGLEEEFMKQRSKLHWLKVGNRNNKAFYNAARQRERRNVIREVECYSGNIISTQEKIKVDAEKFFCEFMFCTPTDMQHPAIDSLQELLSFRCSETDQSTLTREVADEEIRYVYFHMPCDNLQTGNCGIFQRIMAYN